MVGRFLLIARLGDPRSWHFEVEQTMEHSFPGVASFVTPAVQPLVEEVAHQPPELAQAAEVARHPIIVPVAS